MTKPLRIGWIGAGFIGQVAHLANYRDIPGAEVVALAELRPRLAKQVCRSHGIDRYYDHHSKLLEAGDIDAVVAIVHRRHTATIAKDVLNAGYHLFTEKPMAQTEAQSTELAELAKARDLIYGIGFMRRYDQGVCYARDKIAEFRQTNELGSILYARCHLYAGGDYCNISGYIDTDEEKPKHQILPIAPDWLNEERHLDYEHFVNLCSHNINLVRFLFAETPSVDYVRWRRPLGSVVGLSFDSFPLHFEEVDIKANDWREGVEVVFEKGFVQIDMPPAFLRNQPSRVTVFDSSRSPIIEHSPKLDWTWAFYNQDAAFVEAVKSGKAPASSGADSVEDMTLTEEIWRHIEG